MVEHQLSLKQASIELELDLTQAECERLLKRKAFQEVLREERNRYYAEVANDPTRNKATAVGLLMVSIQRLYDQGDYDKCIAGIEKLAKLENWIGPDSNVNIFAGLSAKDIADAKQRIISSLKSPDSPEPTPDKLAN